MASEQPEEIKIAEDSVITKKRDNSLASFGDSQFINPVTNQNSPKIGKSNENDNVSFKKDSHQNLLEPDDFDQKRLRLNLNYLNSSMNSLTSF